MAYITIRNKILEILKEPEMVILYVNDDDNHDDDNTTDFVIGEDDIIDIIGETGITD